MKTNSTWPPLAACVICSAVWLLRADCGTAQTTDVVPADVSRLVDLLNSDSSVYDKAMACRDLTLVGDERAISSLSPLLADSRLAAYARTALEAIPGESADRALREAASSLRGELLVGVLDSLGRRRDSEAVEQLSQLLTAEDLQVSGAAARALGHIGTPPAGEALAAAVPRTPRASRPIVGWACLTCAARLEREGQSELAGQLYGAVRQAEMPPRLVLAATRREIVSRGELGLERLSQLLGSDDESAFRAALHAARELGTLSTPPLIESLESALPERQIPLLVTLADLGDLDAVPAMLAVSASPAPAVRRKAMELLAPFDSPAVTGKLLEGLSDPEPSVAAAARDALVRRAGDDVDLAIVAQLKNGDSSVLLSAIEVAGQRQISRATETLFRLLEHEAADVRVAATKALGSTVALTDLTRLVVLATEASGEQRQAADQALAAACARLPREACATALGEAMQGAVLENQIMLLQQLAALGGKQALQTVAAGARAEDDRLQDVATRLLGTWPTSDVAGPLRELVVSLPSAKYRTRLLRGYLRVARQLDMTPEERIDVCRQVLQSAERDEERKLVLEVLRRYPNVDGLKLAASLLPSRSVRSDTVAAAAAIAESTAQDWPAETAETLQGTLKWLSEPTQPTAITAALAAARSRAEQAEAAAGFVPLFDETTWKGWHGNLDVFRVEDGQIVGGSLTQPVARNEFLRTDKSYGDFELRLQFRLLGDSPNAGVQIRTQEIEGDHEVRGYQADLGPGWWGCLYDESRRNRVLAGPPAATRSDPVWEGEWNDYRIRCEGKRIQLWINGVQTVDYLETDSEIPLQGIIALQIHSGDPAEARYRNLRIQSLGSN